jgi:hypothetical protein
VSEDRRVVDEGAAAEQTEDVEAHGVKEVAGVGLAAAALIGAGAAGVKMATDDDQSRNQGALVAERSVAERLARADADKDGYVNYGELAHEGFKFNVEELNAEGVEVTAEGLAAAGHKVELGLIGAEDGFALKGDTIMLKWGPDPALDELAKGSASEWTIKLREIDRDGDGYAAYEELNEVGWKWDPAALNEAFHKDGDAADLAKAGYKQPLHTFGEGGFPVDENTVMLKRGIDGDLDALFIKGEKES